MPSNPAPVVNNTPAIIENGMASPAEQIQYQRNTPQPLPRYHVSLLDYNILTGLYMYYIQWLEEYWTHQMVEYGLKDNYFLNPEEISWLLTTF